MGHPATTKVLPSRTKVRVFHLKKAVGGGVPTDNKQIPYGNDRKKSNGESRVGIGGCSRANFGYLRQSGLKALTYQSCPDTKH
jgi:hypothetical protein